MLFRQGDRSYDTFAQTAAYLYPTDERGRWYDLGLRTMECTKRMMSVSLYGALQVLGTAFFDDLVTGQFDLARAFAAHLRTLADVEVATDPEANIVCFRVMPPGVADLEALAAAVRETGAELAAAR